jgi:O-antigen ligase
VQLFRHQPVFGIGQGSYAEEVGQVAHNSFLHAFTELGFVGGAFFLGTFTAALLMLRRLRDDEMLAEDRSELMRMLPYLMAMLVGFVVSMLSLSRNYFVPTYLVLGVATSYVQIATGQTGLLPLKFDSWFLKRLAVGSVCFLAAIYVFVRVTVQWS